MRKRMLQNSEQLTDRDIEDYVQTVKKDRAHSELLGSAQHSHNMQRNSFRQTNMLTNYNKYQHIWNSNIG